MDAFPGSSKPSTSYYGTTIPNCTLASVPGRIVFWLTRVQRAPPGPVLSSTQEDEDPAAVRGRRRSPVPPLPLPLARPADEAKREAAVLPAEALYVDLPPEKMPLPGCPPEAEVEQDGDPESSETEKTSPFAPLMAAEVPLQTKKKTFFDLSPREMMNRMEWPRRKKKTKKAEAGESSRDPVSGDAVLPTSSSDGDTDRDGPRPGTSRQPHSTPSSPAASKKTPKRTLSSSPIR